MKTVDTHGSFEDVIVGSSTLVEEIALRLRKLIINVYPDVYEVPWPKQSIAGYGVGPKKMSEHFCYIAVQKARVNLGFYYGADLPDPEGLLEGKGKKMRHIKVYSVEDSENLALRQLLKISIDDRKRALGL